MKNFWRVPASNQIDTSQNQFRSDSGLLGRLRPRDGLVISTWDDDSETGHAEALGVVISVNPANATAMVQWQECDVTLKPNPGGRQYWRKKPFFRFADAVAIRYMLDDLFAEHFPDMSGLDFDVPRPPATYSSNGTHSVTQGYVYLIKSEHGFKIGKTVNIKSRYRIFGIKLPFPIELIHYAQFDDYTGAERAFHDHFSVKRLEGEWFNLNQNDIEYIKSKGSPMSLEGLM